MSQKNYQTVNGLYKALLKQKRTYSSEYTFERKGWNVIIFNSEDNEGAISGTLIEDLMPVLERCYWMIRYSDYHERIELIAWVKNEIV